MKKNYAIVAAGLGLVQLVLLSTATRAQDTTRTLNDVVVTASRSPKNYQTLAAWLPLLRLPTLATHRVSRCPNY